MRLTDEQLQVIRDLVVAIDDDAMSQWQWCAVSLLGEVEALRAERDEAIDRERILSETVDKQLVAHHRDETALRARITAALAIEDMPGVPPNAHDLGWTRCRNAFRAALVEPVGDTIADALRADLRARTLAVEPVGEPPRRSCTPTEPGDAT